MTAPFIVRSVSRIHPGKADAYRPVAAEFCRFAQEREPRLLGFHIYVTEDGSSEVVVQIHPDAESMQHHIAVMATRFGRRSLTPTSRAWRSTASQTRS